MTWTIHIAKGAQKRLANAPVKSRRLILSALEEMQENPLSGDVKRLTSERSTWRRRVGAYRIFFDIDPGRRHIDVLDIVRRTFTTYD
jgi:mRNA-degrading endonuclease RelE of RelBE toxin-antitoxin system